MLINLTNNSGSEYKLLNTTFYTLLSLIIITKSKCINKINTRKFSFDY